MTPDAATRAGPTLAQRVPFDLVAVVLLAGATLVLAGGAVSPLRVVLGLLFVFVLPGYALVAALFPERTVEDEGDEPIEGLAGIGPGVRLLLSVALSLFLVPLAGILHNFSPAGIAPGTVLPTLAGFTALAAGVAAYRRSGRPATRRFGLQAGTWLRAGVDWVRTDGDGRAIDRALNVLLVVGLVLATVGIVTAVGTPANGERYTEYGLLAPDPDTGAPTATGYPTALVVGEPETLYLDLRNREGRTVDYTVVVALQRLDGDGRVVESHELDRVERTLAADEAWRTRHTLRPTDAMTGEDLRLSYLLYTDAVPANPDPASAHRELHLWVDVTAGDATAGDTTEGGGGASP